MAKAIDWIKMNYDRAAVIAAAVFLFISAICISWSAIQFRNELITQLPPRPKPASQPPVAVELDRAAEQLQAPSQWKASTRSGLFVPEKHFIGADGLPATLENTQVHPPVPNEWFEKYGLPIEEADVLDQDPDKDGFTNLDEWQGNTDPTNKDSHPDYITKLHLVSATEEPFRYIFSSRIGETFGINDIEQSEPTQFRKVGDVIRGTGFKIVKFTEKSERNQYGIMRTCRSCSSSTRTTNRRRWTGVSLALPCSFTGSPWSWRLQHPQSPRRPALTNVIGNYT